MRRILLVLVVSLLLAGFVLWWAITPPAPLALPEQGVELSNVTLVQPGEGRREGRSLRVEGGSIASIAAATGSDAYDGATVLPGLIDMHVHFPPKGLPGQSELFAFLFLAHGVTTVRDAADADGTSTAPVRDGVRDGSFPGPRVMACGPLVDGPEPVWVNSLVLTDPADAEAAIAGIAASGFDCVKVYNSLDAEVLAAIQAAAARHELPVIGHVPRQVPFEQARVADVQHLTGVLSGADGPGRFPDLLAGWRSFDEQRARFITGISLAYDIAHTPTLVVLERRVAMRDYEALRNSDEARLLPRVYRDVVWSPTEGLPFVRNPSEATFQLFADGLVGSRALVGRMHAAGVRIHAGTDTQIPFLIPGAALHREIRLLSEAGLGPEAGLAAATAVPGETLGIPGLGRLEVGAPADLAIFREDPTRDLANLDTLVAVVADGRLYPKAELDAQLARYQSHHDNPVFDAVSVAVARRLMADVFAEAGEAAD